mmetsp:Transcript_7133/g.20134  ORF Transcript_7133/g.20134 Transcript_7133/m.20134 type:complete len:256 (-) Transcript_7133:1872-2639(-)
MAEEPAEPAEAGPEPEPSSGAAWLRGQDALGERPGARPVLLPGCFQPPGWRRRREWGGLGGPADGQWRHSPAAPAPPATGPTAAPAAADAWGAAGIHGAAARAALRDDAWAADVRAALLTAAAAAGALPGDGGRRPSSGHAVEPAAADGAPDAAEADGPGAGAAACGHEPPAAGRHHGPGPQAEPGQAAAAGKAQAAAGSCNPPWSEPRPDAPFVQDGLRDDARHAWRRDATAARSERRGAGPCHADAGHPEEPH